jgi:hypothetical protein
MKQPAVHADPKHTSPEPQGEPGARFDQAVVLMPG